MKIAKTSKQAFPFEAQISLNINVPSVLSILVRFYSGRYRDLLFYYVGPSLYKRISDV